MLQILASLILLRKRSEVALSEMERDLSGANAKALQEALVERKPNKMPTESWRRSIGSTMHFNMGDLSTTGELKMSYKILEPQISVDFTA